MFLEHSLTMIDLSLSLSTTGAGVYQGHVVTFDLLSFTFRDCRPAQLIVD